jgi:DNA-binding response OmpR family regulator
MNQEPENVEARRVLVVEDDVWFRKSLVRYLELSGYRTTGVGSALDFYHEIASNEYQIALLDIGLPDQSGHVLSQYLRNNTGMRVIMLTGHSALEDKLEGYSSGADAYLVKPVDFRELVATVANLFSRLETGPLLQQEVPYAEKMILTQEGSPWVLDSNGWVLTTPQGVVIELMAKEYEFIVFLDSRKKQIVTRQDIRNALDYPATQQANHALDSMIYRLRKKIEQVGGEFPVKNAHGAGYSLFADIIHI